MSDLIDRKAAIDALLAIQRELQMIDISEEADITIHGVQLALHKIEKMPPAEPISQIKWERDIAIAQLQELGYGLGEKPKKEFVKGVIIELSSAQPERETGRWIIHKSPDRYHANKMECSECGFENVEDYEFNYCPLCGAKMGGEE